MKINKLFLKKNVQTIFEEDIDFSSCELDPNHIRKINSAHVVSKVTMYDDLLVVELNIKSDVVGVCCYTLEDVDYQVKVQETLCFSEEEENEDYIYAPDNEIDLDEYVLSIIVSEVPFNLKKKGAKLPDGGKGYRVISEEDFEKERSEKKDPRWSKLDEIDL